MVVGGMNFTVLPVSADEMAAVPAAVEGNAVLPGTVQSDEAVQSVSELLKALPTLDTVKAQTAEQQKESQNQVQAVFDAFNELTDEQKQQLEGAEETLTELTEYFSAAAVSAASAETSAEGQPETDGGTEELEQVTTYVSPDKGRYGNFGSGKLTGISQKVYSYLKTEIQKIADGNRTSATFDISAIVSTSAEAKEVSDNLNIITSYLLTDCPYELYWYDKSARNAPSGSQGAINYSYSQSQDGKASNVIVRMLVSAEYRSDNLEGQEGWYYTADAAKAKAANAVTAKAQEIVDANESKSDRDKLLAYKNAICDLVSYNTNAAEPDYNGSNEAWQLIAVFDGDPDTNVVCEGYSKAFQYLCDLSQFNKAKCYTVTGVMAGGTGAGSHMCHNSSHPPDNYLLRC